MHVSSILNIFLSIICIGLIFLFANINGRLQNCLKNREESNDDGKVSDDDDDYFSTDSKDKCKPMDDAIFAFKKRSSSLVGFPYPKNFTGQLLDRNLLNIAKNYLVAQAMRTQDYNVEALRFVVAQSSGDSYSESILAPAIIGYCMVATGLKRNTDVERFLVDFVKKYKDPFVSTDQVELFTKLSYHVIFEGYQKKNDLALYKPDDAIAQRINDTLNVRVKSQSFPSTNLSNGFFHNKTNGEIGYVYDQRANGLGYMLRLIEPLTYVSRVDAIVKNLTNRRLVSRSLKFAYDRLYFTVRENYVQTLGGREWEPTYANRDNLLRALTLLFLSHPFRFSLNSDQWTVLGKTSISPTLDSTHFCGVVKSTEKLVDSIQRTDKQLSSVRVASRSEGFALLAHDWFTFEQSWLSPYLKYDRVKFNGYLNYGIDYSELFRSSEEFQIPGYVSIKQNSFPPNRGSLVKLDEDLHYQSTYGFNDVYVNGIVDGRTKTHRVYVTSNDALTYCLFGWIYEASCPILRSGEQLYLFYRRTRITLKCSSDDDSTSYKINYKTLVLYSGRTYVYFTVDVPALTLMKATITFSIGDVDDDYDPKQLEATNAKRIDDYAITNRLISDVSITPDKNKNQITMVKRVSTGSWYVVDENTMLTDDNPKLATNAKNEQFPFSDQSMGRVAVVTT